ncbi:LytR/AlgR family response regulator transcription factor [Microbulbifer yueqingensis]|uniref:Two component transcriptional regulator, LytTR family n=1 Tax=Microbulbifer yueqingensis TaxID=658219 RepID=A0A1G9DEF6_9GAMM|nr:LytTR family DNA-binding domain-containing protein [Microbulbifer yueqingensis]SDK62271.1 two component transcriptional regulator, LytTR family [Microbulbifer yueqingensis]
MTHLRAVIVDDEPLALRLLQAMLEELPDIEVVASCRNGREALNAVARHTPDILFLDVQMPGMNGFEVVRRLQGDTIPLVVFATAYDQYAVDAFEVHAVDYVLKPLETERLQTALSRARERLQGDSAHTGGSEKNRLLASMEDIEQRSQGGASSAPSESQPREGKAKLAIKDRGRITMICQADIEWIDAAGDYMCVHASGETHVMRSTMKELQEQLCSDNFKRVHRSTLVNLNFIEHIQVLSKGEYLLTLASGSEVKVSRNYRQPIKEYLDASRGQAAIT